jgi:hypothetical protein
LPQESFDGGINRHGRLAMTTFAEFLNEQRADMETVVQATRYWVAEKSDDATIDDQRKVLGDAMPPKEFGRITDLLSDKPDLLEAVCLMVLSRAWEQPGEAQRIAAAIVAAKTKLPVTNKVLLTIAAMYAMYLLATSGGCDIHQTTVRDPDGTYRQEQVISHAPFAPVIEPILHLFDLAHGGPGHAKAGHETKPRPKASRSSSAKAAKPPAAKAKHSKKDQCR